MSCYLPFFQPAPIVVGTQQRSPPACPGGRRWRARCRSSTSTFRGNTSCLRATRRTSWAGHPRRLGKSRWWYLESGPRQALLSGSPVICNKVGWMWINQQSATRQHHYPDRAIKFLSSTSSDALLTKTSAFWEWGAQGDNRRPTCPSGRRQSQQCVARNPWSRND